MPTLKQRSHSAVGVGADVPRASRRSGAATSSTWARHVHLGMLLGGKCRDVITSLRSARDRASKVREYERTGQIAAAVGQWQIVFGKDGFPAYG